VIESARRHGPFDPRFQDRPAAALAIPDAEIRDGLDWEAFSAQLSSGRHRHDLEGIKAYGAYANGRSHLAEASEVSQPSLAQAHVLPVGRSWFIAPEGCENELFVSRSDLAAGSQALQDGARVEFEERRGGHGRTAATNVNVRAASQIRSVEESAESDAENEGMPPKPESPSDRALGQGARAPESRRIPAGAGPSRPKARRGNRHPSNRRRRFP
jgi:cold shock CspA family protein